MTLSIISPDFILSDNALQKIATALPGVRIVESGSCSDHEIDAVIVDDSTNRELSRFSNLKIILSISAGVDNLLNEPNLPPIPIVRITSVDMISLMREYVIYQVIKLHRGFKEIEKLQFNRDWVWMPPCNAPSAYRVAILGLGQLGMACANSIKSLGFQVFGWSNSPKTIDGVVCESGIEGLEKILPLTDILICLLPLTDMTKEILNKSLFYKLPYGASVINVSRGGCLNEADLIAALNDRHIFSAALDVFVNEPLPRESTLWSHPHITITPHLAAYPIADSFTDSLIENIQRYINGAKLEKIVSRKLGY